jgi:hypothetical protein
MLNFCTLFTTQYKTRGLAMYKSLKKHCDSFHLYILAMDDLCFNDLKKLELENVTLISLNEFENKYLLDVKKLRNITEYCWTCKSSLILYCLEKYKMDMIAGLDSDILFLNNPDALFNEMGNNSVIITDHNYTKEYDQTLKSGKYNAGFIIFKNDDNGLKALKWWVYKCIEWCFDKKYKGKFGDQKYIEEMSTFEGVIKTKYFNGAPWNIQDNVDKDLIYYHFHQVEIEEKKQLYYIIPDVVYKKIYHEYFKYF